MSKKNEKKDKAPETEQPAETAEQKPEEQKPEEQPEQKPEQPAPEDGALAALRAEHAELNDRYLRMLAEYDNYRRRSQKERESIYEMVRADTVVKFLPVYDNLARAAQHETDDETRKGVEGILNQLKSILAGLGVTEIETVGKRFDPALHDALMHIEDPKYGEGEIVLELEKGFKLGDRVIRFARVQVAN